MRSGWERRQTLVAHQQEVWPGARASSPSLYGKIEIGRLEVEDDEWGPRVSDKVRGTVGWAAELLDGLSTQHKRRKMG